MAIETKVDTVNALKEFEALPLQTTLDTEKIKNCFSGLLLSVVENSLPNGVILIWHPKTGDLPSGWHLCDGTGGTPDLTGEALTYIMKSNPKALPPVVPVVAGLGK